MWWGSANIPACIDTSECSNIDFNSTVGIYTTVWKHAILYCNFITECREQHPQIRWIFIMAQLIVLKSPSWCEFSPWHPTHCSEADIYCYRILSSIKNHRVQACREDWIVRWCLFWWILWDSYAETLYGIIQSQTMHQSLPTMHKDCRLNAITGQ